MRNRRHQLNQEKGVIQRQWRCFSFFNDRSCYRLLSMLFCIFVCWNVSAIDLRDAAKQGEVKVLGADIHFLKKPMIHALYYKRVNVMNNACKIMTQFQKECLACYNKNKKAETIDGYATKGNPDVCAFNSEDFPSYESNQQYYTYWLENDELRKTLNLPADADVFVEGTQSCLIKLNVHFRNNNQGLPFEFVSRLLPIKDKRQQKMVYDMNINTAGKASLLNVVYDAPACLTLGFTRNIGFNRIWGRSILPVDEGYE